MSIRVLRRMAYRARLGGAEACIVVANSPYFHVFGGDISAGNAQASAACDPSEDDYDAGIVGWNQDGGIYSGAGTQFAEYAIGKITEFASAQANPNNQAGTAPSGLAFANTTAASGGVYGGSLGIGSQPCMNDYYMVPPGATNINSNTAQPDTINLGTLTSGAYVYNGPGTLTLYGTLTSGVNVSRIQLFVPNQNVYVSNNITYQGNWQTLAGIPMLELVVNQASIYVDHAVTELDGTYVAQNSQTNGKGTGGQIATCATAAGPEPANTTLSQNCNTQLIINGAFVADDVALERTAGTLKDGTGDSASNLTSAAAEQFNYNPSLWVVQPPTGNGDLTYNTIIDLPPVL
jgi:hypothetical protein